MAAPAVVNTQAKSNTTGAGLSLNTVAGQADDYELWPVQTAAQAIALNAVNGASLVSGSEQDGGTSTRITVFQRIWNGTDGTPNLTDSGDHQLRRGFSIRGVDLTTPLNLAPQVGQIASGTDIEIDLSGVSTTRDECLIVWAITADAPSADGANSTDFGAFTAANLTSVTKRYESTTNNGVGGLLYAGHGVLATAGPIGVISATSTTTSVKSYCVLAVQPPATPGGGRGGTIPEGMEFDASSGLVIPNNARRLVVPVAQLPASRRAA